MDSFVSRENIRRYRKLASESTNATERSRIMKLLAEEETKFKLELRRRGDPPEEDDRRSTRQPRIRSSMTERSSEMVASRKAADPHANRLLGLLSPRDYERLRPHLHRIPLEYRQSLYRAHKPIEFVYFIETGVGSLVNTMANGQAAEVGTIGNEGAGGSAPRVRRRQGADQRLCPGSRCRPENEGSAVQEGTGAKRFDANGDASLCSRLLQPGRAVRRVQSLSFPRAAMLPLAADDARPHAIG